MRNSKIDGRLRAVALVAALVVGLPTGASADKGEIEKMEQMAFDVGSGGTLRVEVGDADIKVSSGGEKVEVETWIRGNDLEWGREYYRKMQFSGRQDGQTVILRTEPQSNVNWGRKRWVSIEVRVVVPEQFNLDLHTGDGDIMVGKLRGTLDLHSGDGDLQLEDIEGSEITLRTGDGDVMAGRLAGSSVTVHTGDGDVQIGKAEATMKVSTGDGDVHIAGLAGEGSQVRTGDGDVYVSLAQAVSLELRTGDGDIQLSSPSALGLDIELHGEDVHIGRETGLVGTVRNGHASGQLNGGGPLVQAQSGDGTISLSFGEK